MRPSKCSMFFSELLCNWLCYKGDARKALIYNYLCCCNHVTKIIIAQRISSVEDCDKIIVMDDGKISAVGTHEELLKTNEIYKEVYDSQQKGDE